WISDNKMRMMIAYTQTSGGALDYANGTLFFEIHDGPARSISGTDFTAPTLPTNSYWRNGDMVWKDNDQTTGVAYCLVTDRGTRLEGNDYEDPYDFYHDMQGGMTLKAYRIEHPLDPANITFT